MSLTSGFLAVIACAAVALAHAHALGQHQQQHQHQHMSMSPLLGSPLAQFTVQSMLAHEALGGLDVEKDSVELGPPPPPPPPAQDLGPPPPRPPSPDPGQRLHMHNGSDVVNGTQDFMNGTAQRLPQEKQRLKEDILGAGHGMGGTFHKLKHALHLNDQDCVVGEWQDVGSCSKTCAVGSIKQTRSITQEQRHSGKPCPSTERTVECNPQPCPVVACQMTAWSQWTQCSAKCGGGTQHRKRSVKVKPLNGGAACETPREQRRCNTQECPVDCVMGQWSEWGECSKSCGAGGTQVRSRGVLTKAAFGGNKCGVLSEMRKCPQEMQIECPVDCEMNEWSEFTPCSQTCGIGTRRRSRTIKVEPRAGGKACVSKTWEENCMLQRHCPVDCKLSRWHEKFACSKTCGGSDQELYREVLVWPQHGGKPCGALNKTRVCNPQPCPVDCVVSDWIWSKCSRTCGNGERHGYRKVLQPPAHGGKMCPDAAHMQEDTVCNKHKCPVPCEMSNWTDFSPCSRTCGGGLRTRTRTVMHEAQFGGTPCGPLKESKACATRPCPVDCELTNFTAFSKCSATCGEGHKTRRRRIVKASANGGEPCPSQKELSQTVMCDLEPCPVDCEVGNWTAWSPCDATCGDGMRTRTRNVTVEPQFGGRKCKRLTQSKACNLRKCPVECKLSRWSKWTQCNATCGGGIRYKTRSIVRDPLHGGTQCGSLRKEQPCNTHKCPVDCVLSYWSNFSACSRSCGGGVKAKRRRVAQPDMYGGSKCQGALSTIEDCNTQPCPVDCQVSEYSDWGDCSASCGGGMQARTRTITVNVSHGGAKCPVLDEERPCNDQPCPIDCKMSDWSAYTECSVSCGGGTQLRMRKKVVAARYGGEKCGEREEKRDCSTKPCPIHGVVGKWSKWSPCSKKCGGGSKTRSRAVLVQPQFGGNKLPSLSDSKPCNDQPCAQDCAVSPWSAWGPCQATCGEGIQVANRSVTTEALNGGKECPILSKERKCKVKPCPVECQLSKWGAWGSCSKTCGGGAQYRTRRVLRKPKHGGDKCGSTKEKRDCNSQPCPVHCRVSRWKWSACSATCGGGHRLRYRNMTVAARNGGNACPVLSKRYRCGTRPCPVDCVVGPWSKFSMCSRSCGGGVMTRVRHVKVRARWGGKRCPTQYQRIKCNQDKCVRKLSCGEECMPGCVPKMDSAGNALKAVSKVAEAKKWEKQSNAEKKRAYAEYRRLHGELRKVYRKWRRSYRKLNQQQRKQTLSNMRSMQKLLQNYRLNVYHISKRVSHFRHCVGHCHTKCHRRRGCQRAQYWHKRVTSAFLWRCESRQRKTKDVCEKELETPNRSWKKYPENACRQSKCHDMRYEEYSQYRQFLSDCVANEELFGSTTPPKDGQDGKQDQDDQEKAEPADEEAKRLRQAKRHHECQRFARVKMKRVREKVQQTCKQEHCDNYKRWYTNAVESSTLRCKRHQKSRRLREKRRARGRGSSRKRKRTELSDTEERKIEEHCAKQVAKSEPGWRARRDKACVPLKKRKLSTCQAAYREVNELGEELWFNCRHKDKTSADKCSALLASKRKEWTKTARKTCAHAKCERAKSSFDEKSTVFFDHCRKAGTAVECTAKLQEHQKAKGWLKARDRACPKPKPSKRAKSLSLPAPKRPPRKRGLPRRRGKKGKRKTAKAKRVPKRKPKRMPRRKPKRKRR